MIPLHHIDAGSIKYKFLPVEFLVQLKSDLMEFGRTEQLNGFQKWIVHDRYILDQPMLSFTPKTILVVAIKYTLVNGIFHCNGQSVVDLFCVKGEGIKEKIRRSFSDNGLNAEYVHWLPQKRLAVCSGLALYGRNNLTYIDGWGSFFELQTFLTDMPSDQDYVTTKVSCMEICNSCDACQNHCPTGAIGSDRFLINNELCLTRFVEAGGSFPPWLPANSHHSVNGCYRCQDVCPVNQEVLSKARDTVNFSQDETGRLLAGVKREEMPPSLLEKVEKLGIEDWCLANLPRNLKAIFAAAPKTTA